MKLSIKHFIYLLSLSLVVLVNACSGQKKVADTENVKAPMTQETKDVAVGEPVQMNKKTDVDRPAPKPDKTEILVEDREVVLENALLWKISGNGLEKESYLYGTIHIIDADAFFWPKNTMETFNKSEKVVFEIDLDEMSDMSNIFGMMTKVMMKDGMTLKKLLSNEDYTIVTSHFEDMGLPMFMLEKMKPMFLTIFAEGDMDMGAMTGGGDPAAATSKSYEMEFYELANNTEKEVSGLETIDDQISLFDSIPYADQATMLVESIKASKDADSEAESEMEKLTQMYLDQNINEMVAAIEDEDSEFAGFEDLLLNDRNQKWIPQMSAYMKAGTTFFAVGAGHLAGQQGVINLLRTVGYELTPLSQVE